MNFHSFKRPKTFSISREKFEQRSNENAQKENKQTKDEENKVYKPIWRGPWFAKASHWRARPKQRTPFCPCI
jgi:hypothetical protein